MMGSRGVGVAPLTQYQSPTDGGMVVMPPKVEPFMYLTSGKFMTAMAIAYVNIFGCYLYSIGYADIVRGLTESGHLTMCSWSGWFQAISIMAPATCVLRMFFAPAFWVFVGERRNIVAACINPASLLWMVSYFVPLAMIVYMLVFPGFRDLMSPENTIRNWPMECHVARPYHGLFQTRSFALLTALILEGLMNLWIVLRPYTADSRSVAFSLPCLCANMLLLGAGPVTFLLRYEGAPCQDLWIEYTFVVGICVLAFIKLVLIIAPFGFQDAIKSTNTVFGPYAYWSTAIFLLVGVAQIALLTTIQSYAQEMKLGPPWRACGVDYKEFWFPRQIGAMYWTYAELSSYCFWILGMWLWPTSWEPQLY